MEDCYTLFSDKSGSPYLDDLWDALDWHWQSYTVFHVDRAAAEDAVKRWDFAERPDAMKELLIAVYSDELRRFSPEVLFHANESEILEEVYQKDPVLAIRMWRFLLDTAEAHLQEPEAAQYLLWEIIDFALFPPYLPLPHIKRAGRRPPFCPTGLWQRLCGFSPFIPARWLCCLRTAGAEGKTTAYPF